MKKRRSAFLLEKLEPRLLFSADLALLPVDGGFLPADQDVLLVAPAQLSGDSVQTAEVVEQVQREVIFIDAGVEDYQQLLDDIQAQVEDGRQFETVLLDNNTDGITQISDYLSSQQDISAVHIISHGSNGEVVLGDSPLNLATLDSYAETIEGWQNALTGQADLLFYGCNLASGAEGQTLISSLALLTNADVAASDDATGQAVLGGDWELEYATGQIETSIAFSSDVQQTWAQLLNETVADNFTNIAYDGSDGTKPWSNDWQEINESDGAGAGNMQVYDRLSWGRGLYLWKDHVGAWREVDLSGAVAATLSFDVATSGLDAGDSVTLEISTDGGGTWDVIETYDSNSGLQAVSYDISAYIDNDTQIKFESTTFGDNDEFFVDNLQINFTTGLASTSEFLVNTPDMGNPQETSAESRGSEQAVAMADNGNYVVVWSSLNQDGSGWGVFAQRYNNAGNALGGEFQVTETTADNQLWARVAMDAGGSFTVTWTSENQDGTTSSVYARQFNPAGNPTGSEFRVNTENSGAQSNSSIAMDDGGNFTIVWQGDGPGGDSNGIYFRRFNADGSAIDLTDQLANQPDGTAQHDPVIAMQTAGKFVIAWDEGSHIYFQRFDALGAALGGETQIDGPFSTSSGLAVDSDSSGNFTFVYREESIGTGIWCRGFNEDGSENYGWQQIASGDAISPSISMDAAGNHLVVYEKTGDGDGLGVYGRKYDSAGSALDSEFLINETTTGTQHMVSAAMLDINNFVAVWSGEGATDDSGVYARQFSTGNTAPVATADSFTVAEGASSNLDLAGNDTDADDGLDLASINIISGPNNGTIDTINAGGTVDYTHDGSETLTDSFTYTIDDHAGATSNTVTVDLTITPVNDAPVAGDDTATVNEAESVVIDLVGNDSDADNALDLNSITLISSPGNGSLVDNGDGTLTYTHDGSETLSDSFTYTIDDVSGATSNVTSVTITVNPVNDAPTFTSFVGSATSGDEDSEITVTFGNLAVQGDEADADGTVDAFVVKSVLSGTLRIGADAGTATAWVAGSNDTLNATTHAFWTPDGDANGLLNAFEVVAQDNNGAESITNVPVPVTVNPVNDAPTATNMGVTVLYVEDTPLDLTDITISDVDSPNVTAILTLSDPSAGSLSTATSGSVSSSFVASTGMWVASGAVADVNMLLSSVTFSPALNYDSVFTISTRVDDGVAAPITGTITVNSTPVNDAGSFTGDTGATIDEDTSAGGTLTFSDAADGATTPNYRIEAGDEASNGTAGINASGTWTYTPNSNFNGSDSFTVSVTDDDGHVETQVISIAVTAVTDLSASDDSFSANEDTALVDSVATNDSTTSGGILSYAVNTDVSNGSLTLNNDGSFTYTPDADFNGSDSFSYTVTDADSGESSTQNVAITVNQVDDATTFGGDLIGSGAEDGGDITGTLTASDSADGMTTPNFTVSSVASNGTASIDAVSGDWTYAPNSNFNGSDSFTVSVTDDDGNTATQTISITVNPVNDAPNVANLIADQTATEDAPFTFQFATNTFNDVDGDTLTYTSDASGWLSFDAATRTFSGTPLNADVGTTTVIVTAGDGNGGTISDTFDIVISNTNDAPTAINLDNLSVDEFSSGAIVGNLNTTDIDSGDTHTYTVDDARFEIVAGQLKLQAGQSLDHETEASVDITVTSTDSGGLSTNQLFTITVNDLNDTPVAVNDNLSAIEDNPLTITSMTDLLVNDADPDGDSLSMSAFTQPAHGTLVDHGDGTLTYTPDNDFSNTDSFNYTISDGNGGSAGGTAFIYVAPVGDTPQVEDSVVLAGSQSAPIVISRHAADGAEVTHFRISGINGGSLFLVNGVTQVNNGDYVSVSQGQAGLRFTPADDAAEGSFQVESSEDGVTVAAQSGRATSTIRVTVLPPTSTPEPEITPEIEESIEEIVEEESTEEETTEVVEETLESVEAPVETQLPVKEDSAANSESGQSGSRNSLINPILSFIRNVEATNDNGSSLDAGSLSTLQTLNVLLETTPIETLRNVWDSLDIGTLSVRDYDLVRSSFDALQQEVKQENRIETAVVSSAIATTMGLSAGYVVWMLKGGSLLASVLSSMPAWHLADPLSILAGGSRDDEDDESLESIIKDGEEKEAKKEEEDNQ